LLKTLAPDSGRSAERKDPVVQRQRLLAYNQETMVRVHPGLLTEASRRRQLRVLLCLPEAQAGHTGPRRGARPSPPPCHGGDRGFKSHRGRFAARGARYANRQSGEAQTFVTCGFDSHSCHYSQEIRVGWALACPSGCNPPACRQCRFDSCPTHWSV
jgi:hypothetical protein